MMGRPDGACCGIVQEWNARVQLTTWKPTPKGAKEVVSEADGHMLQNKEEDGEVDWELKKDLLSEQEPSLMLSCPCRRREALEWAHSRLLRGACAPLLGAGACRRGREAEAAVEASQPQAGGACLQLDDGG